MMKLKIDKTIFKNSLVYIISEFSVKTIPLFLIPLLTAKLSKSEYGIVVNFQVIAYFLNIAVALGTYTTFWPTLNDRDYNAKKLFSNFAVIPMMMGIILFLSVLLFVSGSFLGVPVPFLLLGILVAVGEYFITLLGFLWLFEKKASFNAIFKICRAIFEVGLIFLVFHYWGTSWQTRIIIIALSAFTFFTVSAVYLLRNNLIKFNADKQSVKKIISKSIPAIPYELNLPIRQIFERWFILIFLGAVFNGTYGLSVQLTTPVHLLCVALFNAVIPYIYNYKNSNTVESAAKLKKIVVLYIAVIISVSLLYIAVLPVAFKYFIDKKYEDSLAISILLLIAVLLKNVHGLFTQFIIYMHKTKVLTLLSVVSFSTSLILIFIAAKTTNLHGVAWAVVISEFITLVTVLLILRRLQKVPLEVAFNPESIVLTE